MGEPPAIRAEDPTAALRAIAALEDAILTLRRGLETGNADVIKTALIAVPPRSKLALGIARDYALALEATTA